MNYQTRSLPLRVLSTLPWLVLALACDPAPPPAGPQPGTPAAGDFAVPQSRTLPIPGQAPGAAPAPDATRARGLIWDVPAGWIAEPPSSSMRLAQYRIPGPAGNAECAVFYFGPGQGGDARSNALRWAGQFTLADGSPATEQLKFEHFEQARFATHLVEVRGTYDGGMTMTDAPAQAQRGYMLLGGIAEGPDAPWFFKLTGPEATVEAQREALGDLLRSLRSES